MMNEVKSEFKALKESSVRMRKTSFHWQIEKLNHESILSHYN